MNKNKTNINWDMRMKRKQTSKYWKINNLPNKIFAYFKKRGLFNNIFEKRGGIIDAKVRRISIGKLFKSKWL